MCGIAMVVAKIWGILFETVMSTWCSWRHSEFSGAFYQSKTKLSRLGSLACKNPRKKSDISAPQCNNQLANGQPI